MRAFFRRYCSSRELPAFQFLDPGPLVDRELSLVLLKTYPADPNRSWAPYYSFSMHHTQSHAPMGDIDLRIGHDKNLTHYAGHIGYCVLPEYRGHHYAERSARLLLDLAHRHGITTLWITCSPENTASRRTCERLGAEYIETVRVPAGHELELRGEPIKCRYRLYL